MIRAIKSYKLYFSAALLTLSCTPTESHHPDGNTDQQKTIIDSPKKEAPYSYSKKEPSKKQILYIVKLQAQPLARLQKKHPEFKSITELKKSNAYKNHQEKLEHQRNEFIRKLRESIPGASVVKFYEFATHSVVVQAPPKSQDILSKLQHVIGVHINSNDYSTK